MSFYGVNLALLLIGGFRSLIEGALGDLSREGYPDVRPLQIIALRAVASGADTASELGRRMAVTKQAAAKTIVHLQDLGYLARSRNPADTRRMTLELTDQGRAFLAQSEAIFDRLRLQWESKVGAAELAQLEATLGKLVGEAPVRFDILGWIAKNENLPG